PDSVGEGQRVRIARLVERCAHRLVVGIDSEQPGAGGAGIVQGGEFVEVRGDGRLKSCWVGTVIAIRSGAGEKVEGSILSRGDYPEELHEVGIIDRAVEQRTAIAE